MVLVNTLVILGMGWWVRHKVRFSLKSREYLDPIRREVELLLTQLNGAADRNISILEERILRLQDLVRKADQRIKLLEESLESRLVPTHGQPPPPPRQETPRERVLQLYREGMGIQAIAHRLGMSVAEVQLILGTMEVQS